MEMYSGKSWEYVIKLVQDTLEQSFGTLWVKSVWEPSLNSTCRNHFKNVLLHVRDVGCQVMRRNMENNGKFVIWSHKMDDKNLFPEIPGLTPTTLFYEIVQLIITVSPSFLFYIVNARNTNAWLVFSCSSVRIDLQTN